MSKFNSASRLASVVNRPDVIKNLAGGVAFEMDAKTRLYKKVCNCLLSDTYYQKNTETLAGIIRDIKQVAAIDPEFILKLAAYARNEMYLRSIPIVLLGEAAAINECKPFVRKWVPRILKRADEPAELVAYWVSKHGDIGDKGQAGGTHAFPNSLKKGISDVLNTFGEYHFLKYDRSKSVKIKDVIRVCRAKPSDVLHDAIFKYMCHDIENDDVMVLHKAHKEFAKIDNFEEARHLIRAGDMTWEMAVSKFGNKPEVWDELNLPFMAMLRNIRNIINADAKCIGSVIERLKDPNQVLRSKQLPFRFYSAYREMESLIGTNPNISKVLAALSEAISISVQNVPMLEGITLLAADNSGSMSQAVSERSKVSCANIANLLCAMAHGFCESSIVGAFGTDWCPVNLNPADSIFTNMNRIARADTKGMSTNAYRVVEELLKKKTFADRIFIFSDEQCYGVTAWGYGGGSRKALADLLKDYRRTINPDIKLYTIDLSSYGTTPVPMDEPNVYRIAGWSEKIFDFVKTCEVNNTNVLETINRY